MNISKTVVIRMENASAFLGTANHEMIEMSEIIIRGMIESVDSTTINEACHPIAFPLFGEDYEEYVHELYEIFRSSLNQEDLTALATSWELTNGEGDLKLILLEPEVIMITLEYCHVPDSPVTSTASLRLPCTIGPAV